MKKVVFLFSCFFLLGVLGVFAQTRTITGKVVSSDDNAPIPGVSVIVKGTTLGTVTNIDGDYTLAVPQTANSLMFSFVGYRTIEVTIEGRNVVDVVLPVDIYAVDEVIVTALGISRERKALGYTVQDVKGEDLVKAANPNIMTALSGKIAGLEVRQSSGMPGAPAQIFIRGARSFSGNNQPLYVVDGMPIASNPD